MIIEKHASPDGVLTLVVEQMDATDIAVGFMQSQWHTHANLLVGKYGPDKESALKAFVAAILTDKAVIAIYREGNAIVESMVIDEWDLQNISPGESLELRFWSGCSVSLDARTA